MVINSALHLCSSSYAHRMIHPCSPWVVTSARATWQSVCVCVCGCVRAYSYACARCSVQAYVLTDVDLRMRFVVCCAETSHDACVHTATAFCSLVDSVTRTQDPSLFPMGCHTHTRGEIRGRGACWPGGGRTHCRCSSGELNQCWRSAANSCKGWSPTQRTGMLICWHCVPLIDSSLPDPPLRNRF
jgi:hypothetical protein